MYSNGRSPRGAWIETVEQICQECQITVALPSWESERNKRS